MTLFGSSTSGLYQVIYLQKSHILIMQHINKMPHKLNVLSPYVVPKVLPSQVLSLIWVSCQWQQQVFHKDRCLWDHLFEQLITQIRTFPRVFSLLIYSFGWYCGPYWWTSELWWWSRDFFSIIIKRCKTQNSIPPSNCRCLYSPIC